jgi:hypothetical protein
VRLEAPIMDEDDWLDPQAQGSSADPLVEQEYQRLATRYSDVSARTITDRNTAITLLTA